MTRTPGRAATRGTRARLVPAILWLAACAVLAVGWGLLDFVCDDAYIAFRYASNLRAGWGLTWNPPPFQPVEGYTSFLWVVLLTAVWAATGVEPPESSTWLSLLAGFGTLALGARFVLRMDLGPLSRQRSLVLGLVLLGTAANRTFATWSTSGLETGLFTLLFTWWLYEGTAGEERRGPVWGLRLSVAAALLALARPDGQLACLATLSILLVDGVGRWGGTRAVRWWSGLPLLAVAAHLLWRRATYGAWQPNTYAAKFTEPWPEAGIRYAASFGLEYGLWLWALVVGSALVVALRRGHLSLGSWRRIEAWWPPAAAVGTGLAHWGYYTFVIGGDHFEYRVYQHWVLPLWLLAVWALARAAVRPAVALPALALVVAMSLPVPWGSWYLRRDLDLREAREGAPLAPHFPGPLRPIVSAWDDLQHWLHTERYVGRRYHVHRLLPETKFSVLPTREEGARRYAWDTNRSILAVGSVGVVGWVLPEVAILDRYGLNDRVVARHPIERHPRKMAHDRGPPPGYVECFQPNLVWRRRLVERPDRTPASDERIRFCEARHWVSDPR